MDAPPVSSILSQQPPPSLTITLPLLGLIALYVGYRAWRHLTKRRAQRLLRQSGHDSPSPQKMSVPLVVASLAVAGLFFYLMDGGNGVGALVVKQLGWILPSFVVVMLVVWIGCLVVLVRMADKVLQRARAMREAGDLPGAVATVRKAMEEHHPKKSPTSYGRLCFGLSALLADAGDHAAAESVLREGAAHFPADGAWTVAVATAVAAQGRREEALELLAEAQSKSPREAKVRIAKAEQLIALGRSTEAADALRQAEELAAAYPEHQRTPIKTIRQASGAAGAHRRLDVRV
jgi:tetratricopeptide (TPR) repeat protein